MLYQWSMTTVDPGPAPTKQQHVRERLESLIAGLVPGEPLPRQDSSTPSAVRSASSQVTGRGAWPGTPSVTGRRVGWA